jgi:hypothetical protein
MIVMQAAKKKKKPPWRVLSMEGEARAIANFEGYKHEEGGRDEERIEGKKYLRKPLRCSSQTNGQFFDSRGKNLSAVDPNYSIPGE